MTELLVKFDYSVLDQETQIAVRLASKEIKDQMRRTAQGIVQIGESLADVQSRLAKHGSGIFQAWLKDEFDWSLRTAYRFIAVYEHFGVRANLAQINLAASALYMLAEPSVPEPAREEAVQRGQAGETITPGVARDIIARHKPNPVPPAPAQPSPFYVGQAVFYDGRKMQVVAVDPGPQTATLKSWLNGLRTAGLPFADIQTEAEHQDEQIARRKASRVGGESWPPGSEQQDDPSAQPDAPAPVASPALHPGDLVLNPNGEVFEVVEPPAEDGVWCVAADGEKFELAPPALTVIDFGERPTALTAEQVADVRKLNARASRAWTSGESGTLAGSEPPAAARQTPLPPAGASPEFQVGDRVRTRTGHVGIIRAINGRGIQVETASGTRPHYAETLTKLADDDSATPPQPPATTLQDRLKHQLKEAGLRCFRVVAHRTNGHAGTFSAGIFTDAIGDAAWAEAWQAAEAVRSQGYQVLNAGIDIEPGLSVMGFNGQPAIFVHFAEAGYQPPPLPEPAAPSEADVGSDSDEWFTPADLIAIVRAFLGGIDLDPASCALAQETVQAAAYFDKARDGLKQPWQGRIWLNPPYSRPGGFVRKLLDALGGGAVSEALVLVNNGTDTEWGQALLLRARVVCLTRRINFVHPRRESPGNRQGQMLCYFGPRPIEFARAFQRYGVMVNCCWEPENEASEEASP